MQEWKVYVDTLMAINNKNQHLQKGILNCVTLSNRFISHKTDVTQITRILFDF